MEFNESPLHIEDGISKKWRNEFNCLLVQVENAVKVNVVQKWKLYAKSLRGCIETLRI